MGKFPNSAVGLEIGSRFIKFVELKKSGSSVILNKFGIKEITNDPHLDRDKVISQLISQLLSEHKIKARSVNIAIGGQSVFIRFVKLLHAEEAKLAKTMKFEAQNQIPFPLNEVAWDWSLLDKDKKLTKKAVIAAIKKNLVEELVLKFKKIKLSVDLIDISPICLYNCMAFNEDYEVGKHAAIVDIGERVTNLVIFKEGNMWIRSFPIAAERLREEKEQGLEEFISEIKRSVEYYFMQAVEEGRDRKKIEEVILTGGGSTIDGVESILVNRLDAKLRKMDPFRKLRIAKEIFSDIQSGSNVKNQLAVAIGLALRGITDLKIEINFLRENISEKAVSFQKNLYFRTSIALAILIVVGSSIFMRRDYSVKRSKLNKIEEMIDVYRQYEPKIKNIRDAEDILKEKIDMLYQMAGSRSVWLDVFKIISEILPKDLWITDVSGIVSLNNDALARLDLSGKALSYQDVNAFVSSLKTLPDFKEVKPISSSVGTDEAGEEVVKFSITMDVVVSASLGKK